MAALSDTALLTATREAIDALTTGGASSYSLNGRSVTKLDLKQLWDQVTILEQRVKRSSSGAFGLGVFQNPT